MENLTSKKWHSAIIGASDHQRIVKNLQASEQSKWIKILIDYTNFSDSVLELGSGTGEISANLAYAGRHVSLLDFSVESLAFSQELFDDLELKGSFFEADVLFPFPFNDGSFDHVFSSGLIEHFDHAEQVHILSESARIARKSVMSLVPNANSIPYRLGKWLQESIGTWKWGKEDPLITMENLYGSAGMNHVTEFSVDPMHALNFLNFEGMTLFRDAYRMWMGSMDENQQRMLNQGYLLFTVGYK